MTMAKRTTTTTTSPNRGAAFRPGVSVPGLLVAYAPSSAVTVDRCLVPDPFIMGRSSECHLAVRDDKVSKRHFRIMRNDDGFFIEDLGSRNGTFVDGAPVIAKTLLGGSSVIRAGDAVLVFLEDITPFMEAPGMDRCGMAGRFHTPMLLEMLHDASLSSRHLLLAGPTGTGKELAAQALAKLTGKRGAPSKLIAFNAAKFTNEEEATTTLFGVAARVFSNVDARAGLIEEAHGGILFLDEVHNLPSRIQRSLLRIIEDGCTSRIGEKTTRPADVRFVFASNAEPPEYRMAPDLLARLRVVTIPTLSERVADAPSIFHTLFENSLKQHGKDPSSALACLSGDHYEALCLDRFERANIRGLADVTDRIMTRIRAGSKPEEAVTAVFNDRFRDGPVALRYAHTPRTNTLSHYERNKEIIIAACRECGGNLSATERLLESRKIHCSRRWLMVYLDKWGVRRQ